jgi:hypothetical protein
MYIQKYYSPEVKSKDSIIALVRLLDGSCAGRHFEGSKVEMASLW